MDVDRLVETNAMFSITGILWSQLEALVRDQVSDESKTWYRDAGSERKFDNDVDAGSTWQTSPSKLQDLRPVERAAC
jgi:hypothetical protein